MKSIADLVGRILISALFFMEAADSLLFFDKNLTTIQEYGITWFPKWWLLLSIGILVLGALTVLLGYFARFGAFLLLLYWLPFTFIVYSFWNDPEDLRRIHTLLFMRNMSLAGGLFMLLANGAGKMSVKRLIHVMRLPK